MSKTIDARVSMFGRLAMESGLVTYEDIVSCVEEQEKFRADGKPAPKLGELLVEKGILTDDEVQIILKMQSNPSGLIGRQLVERGLVNRQQLREALDEQANLVQAGVAPPRIGELLVEKGLLRREELQKLLKKQEAPAGHLLGEFLVQNRLIRQEDLDRCLLVQKNVADKGKKPPRLGELLVQCGAIRKEQMELYSRRHAQTRRQVAPPMAATGSIVNKRRGNRRALGEYEIVDTLGQHVDGVSFKALHSSSGATVVMHHFNSETGSELAEAAFSAKIQHAMSLRGHAMQMLLSEDNISGHRAVIAEYVDGITLDRLIQENSKINWAWAAEIIHDLAAVMHSAELLGAHHDDIRPGSIIVDSAGQAKLSLWCYTQDPVLNRDWLAKKHHPIPFYFAPERLQSGPTSQADMFSLGLTMIHALTGTPPLRGNSSADAAERYSGVEIMQDLAVDMDMPLDFIGIISSMVETDPRNRPADFGHLRELMADFMFRQGLETGSVGRGMAEAHEMKPEEAEHVISHFLSSDMAQREQRRVSYAQLFRLFLGPIAAMLLITLGVTLFYKSTQASHGLMVRANWLDQNGDKAGALTLYRMISTLYPKNEVVQQRYFDLAMEVRDHGEAEIALERLMELHPERRVQYTELQADLQVWQRRFISAADLYREVLRSKPDDGEIRMKMANALLWGHDYGAASDEFRQLAAHNPSDGAMLLGLARSAAGAKDYDTANDVFDRLFRMDMLPEATVMEYAWMLNDEGKKEKLREISRTALSRNSSVEYSRKNLTNLNYWAGDYNRARELLDSMVGMTGNDEDSILFRIDLNNKLGNFDQMIDDYQRLADLNPNNTEYTLTIARLYQGRNDFERADASFRRAMSRDRDNVDILLELGDNYSYMGRHDDAIKTYQEALAKRPRDKKATDSLVQELLWSEDYKTAQSHVEQNYRDNPDDHANRVNLALVYSRLGREKEVLKIIDELLAKNELTDSEKERIALNALSSDSNRILLRIIGDSALSNAKITELRLLLARRMRAAGRHTAALPLYAAALAATPSPEPSLLMEMAESANWAKRPDIATRWLEIAHDIVARREGRETLDKFDGPESTRYLMSVEDWNSMLEPLRQQPEIHDALSGFRRQYSRDAAEMGMKKQ